MTTRMLTAVVVLCAGLGAAQAQDVPELFPQLGHSGTVTSVAFSRDGQLLASGSWDKTIKLWDVEGRRELRTLAGHTDKVNAVAFSPNGKLLASGGQDGAVKLWDTTNGKEQLGPIPQWSAVQTVAYSPDGHWLAAGYADGTVTLWDAANLGASRSLDGHCGAIHSIAFSQALHTLAAGCENGAVTLWDLAAVDGPPQILNGHSGAILAVAFANDGHGLAFGGANGTVGLWQDAAKPDIPRTVGHHHGRVRALAFAPDHDRQMLASGAEDSSAALWDLASGNSTTLCARSWVTSVAFSPDGDTLATGGADDNTVKFWNTRDLKAPPCAQPVLAKLGGNSSKVFTVAVSPDGKTLASGSGDTKVKLWDIATGQENTLTGKPGHFADVTAVAFSPKGRWLASGSDDHTVRLWDVVQGGDPRSLTGPDGNIPNGKIRALAFSADGGTLAAAGGDGTIYLWDMTDASRDTARAALRAHAGAVYCLAFSPDGNRLVAGYQHGTIKLWDLVNDGAPVTLGGHDGPVSSVAVSRDGTMMVSGGWDKTVKLWDLANNSRPPRMLGEHAMRVASVAFSPDGALVASGSEDTTIKLWDVAAKLAPHTLHGHGSLVSAVTFSQDGRMLASGSYDGSARLWDVASGREKVAFDAFNDGTSLAITPDGYYDASSAAAEGNLNVRVGNRVFPISTYRDDFYRPDVVRSRIADASIGGVGLGDIRKVIPKPPYIGLIDPPTDVDNATLTVNVRLLDAGGGIGDLILFVNGTAVPTVALPPADGAAPGGVGPITRRYQVQLAAGSNTVRAEVFDAEHAHRNTTYPAKITAHLPTPPTGTLHAVVIGIQQFPNPDNNLKFSIADAQLFGDTLTKYSAPLFAGEPDIKVLATPAQTTREAVRNALRALQKIKAGPNDVFVFYAATHGVVTKDGKYFLITSDVETAASIEKQALGADELAKLLVDIPIPNKLVVLDTCQAQAAGEQIERAVLDKGVSAASSANKLARDIGVTVLAAAESNEDALEEYEDNHGLFTTVVTDGLQGDAHPTEEKTITNDGLASYVKEKVPQLAKNFYRYEQHPTGDTNGAQFDVAKVMAAALAPAAGK
jgi:WD40 repeat protein